MKLESRRSVVGLVVLACAIYFVSYLTRLNYRAAMVEIIREIGITKAQAGLVSTMLFVTYGVGQLFSGVLGDRFSPEWLIFAGVCVTAACNVVMPFSGSVAVMCVIWAVNGFAQAMFWPPLVRILAQSLHSKDYLRAMPAVSAAAQIATILIYFMVPFCISFFDWKSVFFIPAGVGFAIAAVWIAGVKCINRREARRRAEEDVPAGEEPLSASPLAEEPAKGKVPLMPLFAACGMGFLLIAIVLQGFLRDGIITWVPTYVSEVFEMSSASSVLSSVVLPVFSLTFIYLTMWLYGKLFKKNEVAECIALWLVTCAFGAALVFTYDKSAVASLIFAGVIIGCVHGVSALLITVLPARFKKSGRVSTVSGITNAFTYVGSASSSYGLALFAESFGWGWVIGCWALVGGLGLLATLCAACKWKTFIKKEH